MSIIHHNVNVLTILQSKIAKIHFGGSDAISMEILTRRV